MMHAKIRNKKKKLTFAIDIGSKSTYLFSFVKL